MNHPNPPTDGRGLYDWGRVNRLPRRWEDWSEEEVRRAYEAGVAMLDRPSAWGWVIGLFRRSRRSVDSRRPT